MAKDSNQSQKPSAEAIAAGYETSGVSIKGLAIFVACLVVCAAIVHAGAWFLFGSYLHFDREKDRPISGLTAQPGLPPPPRLQPTPGVDPPRAPAADLQQMYRDEDAVFSKLGWQIDPQSHAVRKIPPAAVSEVIRDENGTQEGQKSADAAH